MYKKREQEWTKHLDFMLIDILVLLISYVIAYGCKHGFNLLGMDRFYIEMAVILCLIDFVMMICANLYKNVLKRGRFRELVLTIGSCFLLELIFTTYLFLFKVSSNYSRTVFVLLAVVYILISYPVRLLWKRYLKRTQTEKHQRSMLLVLAKDVAQEAVANISAQVVDDINIVGIAIIDEDMVGMDVSGIKVVAGRDSVADYVCHEWIDEVFIKMKDNSSFPDDLVSQFKQMGVVVHLGIMKRVNVDELPSIVDYVGNYVTVTSSINYVTADKLLVKRIIDICAGLVGCVITGVLFIVLAPAIYISSPGPIFFSQERVGRNGKRFKMYKFRSMYVDAEERKKELMADNRVKDGMMFKLDFDPRIIGARQLPDGRIKKGIGNFIRDFSLDEFPQFLNVLQGDMSLVGTRPPTVDEWDRYELHHRARLAIKPGITGMWQVSGRSGITDFEEVVRLDTKYISEWSLSLDIKIIFKTILAVIKRDGSM